MRNKRRKGRWKDARPSKFAAPCLPELNSDMDWRDQIQASYISKVKFTREDPRAAGEKLDEAVWSRGLPEDVFCIIFACLPLSSLCRMRCVSKKWNLIPQDIIFRAACARFSAREPCLCFTSKDGPFWTYDHSLDTWARIPPPFFYPKESQVKCSLLTAAGGRLLFFRNSPDQKYPLMVYNPLNSTHETLPPMFDMSGNGYPSACEIHVVGMYEDSEKSYYNILVTDRRTNNVSEDAYDSDDSYEDYGLEGINSQVYDSRMCSWDFKEVFDPKHELRMLNGTLYSNKLHCLTVSPHISRTCWSRAIVDQLALYTVVETTWEQQSLRVPIQDVQLVAPHIFTHDGRPMLAAAVPHSLANLKDPFPNWQSIIILEMEMGGMDRGEKWVKWTEISLEELDREQFRVKPDNFFFLFEGNTLYFGSNTGSSIGAINVRTKNWRLLRSFPAYRADLPPKKFQLFAFTPRFDLVA